MKQQRQSLFEIQAERVVRRNIKNSFNLDISQEVLLDSYLGRYYTLCFTVGPLQNFRGF